jgi:hypothetical protein
MYYYSKLTLPKRVEILWSYRTVSYNRCPVRVRVTFRLRLTVSQSVSQSVLVSRPVWGSWPDINYCLTLTVLSLGGRPLWREDRSVVCQSVSSIRSIVSMYNFYILHASHVIEYICNIYDTRPLSVRAQCSRLCPISGSFPITAV